jgi:ABC-type uncharacterized transport system involved in gliding motility auxiliary subunit
LAAGLTENAPPGWQSQAFLKTGANSWVKTGDISSGKVRFNEKEDIRGPVTIGLNLVHDQDPKASAGPNTKQQRVIVTGDGDFLSNQYLGNAGNLELGVNMVNWLSEDENFINIPVKTAPDTSLRLSRTESGAIGFGFLIGMPAVLLGGGLAIWLRRRKF